MSHAQSSPLLRMKNISKSFPGVRALHDVSIQVDYGEILGIIGENGAGKSTLIKTLGGAHLPDNGRIELEGRAIDLTTPIRAQRAGVAVIYQEFNLVPFLSVRENVFLGRAIQAAGLIDARRERDAVTKMFDQWQVPIDPDAPVSSLSIAEQQLVEIAKALNSKVRILVMDEPTATLTNHEVAQLFKTVEDLKSKGIGIIYVSHRIDEVLEITDRVVVLRDGEWIAERKINETNRKELIELMVGRSIENEFPKQKHRPGNVRMKVDGLGWSDRVDDVSFELRSGEVLGITGLVGAGRTELARLIAGAERPDRGTIQIDHQLKRFNSPREGIRAGICLLTEDRKSEGLVLFHSVLENFGLPNLDHFSRGGVLRISREAKALAQRINNLQIKLVSTHQPAGQLSGGNQQKLVLAKWLERDCDIIVIDEPTRGIDIGAKYEIYLLINELAAQGKAVIMISSELPEILGMSDRILVMRRGKIAGQIDQPETATQAQIMTLAAH